MCEEIMRAIVRRASRGARALALLSSLEKNAVLLKMAEAVNANRESIKEANNIDLENAKTKGKNDAFLDRLTLSDKRLDSICDMLKDVAGQKDPIGDIMETVTRPNGLVINKVRVPIGVIGIIYESRPNVTVDCAALCLKSGNAVILRGGSDAINSNQALYEVIKEAAKEMSLDEGAFQLIEDVSRGMVDEMLRATYGIDLIMPRGGESLIKMVAENSRVPVIKHYKGVCHIYVDKEADMTMASDICFNAKVQRPGVCNAMECMIVHEDIANEFLPLITARLKEAGVKIKGCSKTKNILKDDTIVLTKEEDYYEEYLDLILNIKVVATVDEAASHIEKYGSQHSDAIVTNNKANADEFVKKVDSSAVYVNASTRFTDGGEFGKGAEIGISTDKLHARGPMGLEELTTYKYIIQGTGQIRG